MKPTILIVDDAPENIHALMEALKSDYAIKAATNGEKALEMAAATPRPDLILLDVQMPGMDGYEVCRRLKGDEALADIPVIFVSALSDTADKVHGFNLGGLDYVTKPFQYEEVRVRVRTHLALHQLQEELRAKNRELAELQRLKVNLTQMIVHDLNSPLAGAMGYVELGQMDLDNGSHDTCRTSLDSAYRCMNTIRQMITALLDVARLEENRMPLQPADHALEDLLSEAMAAVGSAAQRHEVAVSGAAGVAVYCDADLARRVLQNLIANALRFSPAGSCIQISARTTNGMARIAVGDEGPGVAPEHQQLVFEKFGQIQSAHEGSRKGNGLGLAFCKLAVESQGGAIGVCGRDGGGAEFWFTLPLAGVAALAAG